MRGGKGVDQVCCSGSSPTRACSRSAPGITTLAFSGPSGAQGWSDGGGPWPEVASYPRVLAAPRP
jgi:hypothetical protein